MTKQKVIDDIKANFGGSSGDAEKAIESVVSAVVRTLKADGECRLPGLGTLKLSRGGEVKQGRDPRTGEPNEYLSKARVSVKINSEARAQLD